MKLIFFSILYYFDVLILKIKLKNNILIYFQIKNTLKNTQHHTPEHQIKGIEFGNFSFFFHLGKGNLDWGERG